MNIGDVFWVIALLHSFKVKKKRFIKCQNLWYAITFYWNCMYCNIQTTMYHDHTPTIMIINNPNCHETLLPVHFYPLCKPIVCHLCVYVSKEVFCITSTCPNNGQLFYCFFIIIFRNPDAKV